MKSRPRKPMYTTKAEHQAEHQAVESAEHQAEHQAVESAEHQAEHQAVESVTAAAAPDWTRDLARTLAAVRHGAVSLSELARRTEGAATATVDLVYLSAEYDAARERLASHPLDLGARAIVDVLGPVCARDETVS